MPFDTTYNLIKDTDSAESLMITITGGKDTLINITAEELTALLILHPEISEPLYKYQQAHEKQEHLSDNPESGYTDYSFLIALITVVTIVFVSKKVIPNWSRWRKNLTKINAPRVSVLILTLISIILLLSGKYDFGFMLLFFTFFVVGEFKNEIFYPDRVKNNQDDSIPAHNSIATTKKPVLKYDGADLNFTDTEINSALNKRFPYYVAIGATDKERFIHRVKNFIADKIFYIHDESGYKEMPILISAAAIQLTFGLKKYLLPYFKNIHVFPEEFFRSNNMGICFLEGNVSGNNINLSWKHFLRGYEKSTDGQNVGLHELAHALYYQTFVVEQHIDESFRNSYDEFVDHGNKVYHTEKNVAGGLYSEYAVTNFQEFWAESAEIYFERPALLKELYPSLYEAIRNLLKQDLLDLTSLPIS